MATVLLPNSTQPVSESAGSGFSFASEPRAVAAGVDGVKKKKEIIVRKPVEVPEDHSSERKRTILVAKKANDASSLSKKARGAEVLPLSVLTSKSAAPKRDEEGYVVSHSLLGAPEEYLEQKENLFGRDDEDLRYEEVRLQKQQQELEAYLMTVEIAKKADDDQNNQTISSMQFYDQVGEQKQERALKRREYYEAEWELQKQHLAKVSKKKPDELMINAPDLIREKIEENDVILKAQLREARFFDGQIFKPPESVGPQLAPIYVKYIVPHDEPVEYIRRPGGAKPPQSVRYNPKLRGPASTFNTYKAQQKAHLAEQMKPYQPFEPEFDGLQVRGRRIQVEVNSPLMSRSTTPSLSKVPSKIKEAWGEPEELTEQEIEERQRTARNGVESMAGPKVEFSETELLFETQLDQRQQHTVTASNTGSTAIYYTWSRVIEDNLLEIDRSALEAEERFFFSDTGGVLLPGETRHFVYSFRSSAAGTFFQNWEFTSRPALPVGPVRVALRAMCFPVDDAKELRERLEARLRQQEVERGCRDIVQSIVSRLPAPKRPRPASDAYEIERAAFFDKNQQLGLYYHADVARDFRSIFDRAQSLPRSRTAESEPSEWDVSVLGLHELVLRLEEGDAQAELLRELNELVSKASFPPAHKESPLLHRVGYDLLLELADGVADLAVRERDTLGLPPRARAALGGSESMLSDRPAGAVAASGVAGDAKGADAGLGKKSAPASAVRKKEPSDANAAAAASAAAPNAAAAAAAKDAAEKEKARRARGRAQPAAAAPPPEVKAEPPPQQLQETLKLEETYRQNLHTKVTGLLLEIIGRFEFIADGVPKVQQKSREQELQIQQELERAQKEEEDRLERERKQKEEEEAAARAAASPPNKRKPRAAVRSAKAK